MKKEALEKEAASKRRHYEEKRKMWEYINASEHKDFVDETPENLRGALAYVLWLRDLQMREIIDEQTDRTVSETQVKEWKND